MAHRGAGVVEDPATLFEISFCAAAAIDQQQQQQKEDGDESDSLDPRELPLPLVQQQPSCWLD